MAPHLSWKGYLRLSLVTIPVRAYTAVASDGRGIALNQLHATCNSRIKYKKTCPIHGEVPNAEIVSGYQYAKGQYVIVDTDELEKLRTEDDKAINIHEFVEPEAIDPTYWKGTHHWVLPDSAIACKPYVVLHDGMVKGNRVAVAEVVLHGREQLVLLRPHPDGLFSMSTLNYDPQITKPLTFVDDIPRGGTSPEEMALITTLIGASTAERLDLAKYEDEYVEKLTRLIDAKVAGEEIVAPPAHVHGKIINLMDALKQSVANLQKEREAAERPPKKMAPSKRREAGGARKRKSG